MTRRASSDAFPDASSDATPDAGPSGVTPASTDDLVVTMTDTATPKIAQEKTVIRRKIQCRGLVPKSKNIEANTITVLESMQAYPPFVPHGFKLEAWEKVAELCRSVPDLVNVTGPLCEKRYKEVKAQYKEAMAASSSKETGVAEGPPTRVDCLVEGLIHLEELAEHDGASAREQQTRAFAETNRQTALAMAIREAATLSFVQKAQIQREGVAPAPAPAPTPTPTPAQSAPDTRPTKKRRGYDKSPDARLDRIADLLEKLIEHCTKK
ncbi:hypothetical protein BGZ94_001022 [Podila epigama]|nr:hypothetical protein BGZ94_001022 [Podila epigama]